MLQEFLFIRGGEIARPDGGRGGTWFFGRPGFESFLRGLKSHRVIINGLSPGPRRIALKRGDFFD